ncbi:MAG: class I SAM-dependent methyltransferase, partial [Bryobacteraceae bacterium]
MTIDPYLIKRLPRRHPKRLAYTAWARLVELHSRCFFDEYAIPMVGQPGIPEAPATDWADTQVKPEHASYLLWALHLTSAVGGCVVEVGSWRGVTTAYLAAATDSVVVAVDPYIGDKNEVNLRTFQERTKASRNVILYRLPFGEAVRRWDAGPARLIFVDAVHDYVNVRHDL